MDLLGKLERALEGMVEGVFSRAFRTPLQPIEVAKRLTREVEDHRAVSVSATYVPNVYTVRLAPETCAGFQAISMRLLGELEHYLREFCAERGYQTIGAIAVRLVEDAEVKPGELLVDVENDAHATPSAEPPARAARTDTPATARPSAVFSPDVDRTLYITATTLSALEIVAGEGTGRTLPLADGMSIGRGLANTIALTEMGVSRNHAEIVLADNAWLLRDLGSTNGTFVNGRQITAHSLRAGDTIRIGGTVMKVK